MASEKSKYSRRTRMLVILALLINFGIIGGLIAALSISQERLGKLSEIMDEMAEQSIQADVPVSDTIEIDNDIYIDETIEVGINMYVNTTVPYQTEIPVSEEMMVPVKLGVQDYLEVDTTIRILDELDIYINDTLPIEERMRVMGKGRIPMNIHGVVPINQNLTAKIDQWFRIESTIPVDIPVNDSLPVDLEMSIPINLEIPVKFPLRSNAQISFSGPLPAKSQIPIDLVVPVDIPLEETGLAPLFRKMGSGLRALPTVSGEE